MRLILVRHGETVANVNKFIQGQTDGKLTENGKEQARKLGLRLKDENISRIIASDLGRVRETVAEITAFQKDIVPEFTPAMRERSTGILDGRHYEDYVAEYKKSSLGRFDYEPEGGESYRRFELRVKTFLDNLVSDMSAEAVYVPDTTVLLCAHGAFNKVFIALAMGKNMEDIYDDIQQDNTCVNVFDFSVGKVPEIKLQLLNCTKHLGENNGKNL